MYRASLVLAVLFGCISHPLVTSAQVAPTTTATIAGNVTDTTGKPVADAKIVLEGQKHALTQTDAQGQFVFIGIPFGTYTLSAISTVLGTATRTVSVEGDTDIAIQYEPPSMRGMKVIANVTSNANARFNITPASITQVNPIANAFEGRTSWRTILEQIPGLAQAGLGNGKVNFADATDSPFLPVQIAINGALPYETSTLLDDMPLIGASYGNSAGTGTNLALYPLNGFGSADVVRGPGANAPSIVDSIGGSFLLHAPGVVSANHYDLSVSTDAYGGIVTNVLAAVRWKKLSAVMTYGVNTSPGPLSGAGLPSETACPPLTVDGLPFSTSSSTVLSNPKYQGASYGVATDFLQCCFNQTAAWNQHSGSMALTYALSPSFSAGVFYAGETSQMPNLYTSYATIDFTPPAGYTGSIAPGVHYLAYSGGNGATPVLQSSSLVEEKIIAALGRGTLHLAALQNRTWSSQSNNTLSSATVQLFGAGTWNGNPTVFNGGTYHNVTYSPYSLYGTIVSNNRDLLLSYATPLSENFHAGASFVKSMYNNGGIFAYYYGDPYDCGASFVTYPLADTQTTDELRFFIGGNPSDKTSFDLSMYATTANYHVQNPNNTVLSIDKHYTYAAPRLGFVWRPSTTIAVRAAAGGGFAEAPLNDLIGTNGVPQPNDPTSPTYYTVTLTNLALRPETSFAFDLGTDIRLHRSTTLSFDVYRSNLYGQVYNASTLTGTYTGPAGTLPLYTTQYGNLGVSRYEGILLDLRHDVPHGLYWTLSGGLTRGYVVSLPGGFYNTAGGTCTRATGANCTNVTVVPNINFDGCFAASIPYAQGLGKIGYRWNSEKFIDLVGTYYGSNNTYYRPAFAEFDGHIGYPVTKNASLLLTFRNITGIYDSPLNILAASNFSGAPTITGAPYALYSEMYGPRTAILTMNVHM